MKMRGRSRKAEHRLFKVHASQCDTRVGDQITGDTKVGHAFASGEALWAGCNGVVEAVNWSADEHALFVWVRVS